MTGIYTKTKQKYYLKSQNLCSVIQVWVSTDVCLNISESYIYLRGFIVEKNLGLISQYILLHFAVEKFHLI